MDKVLTFIVTVLVTLGSVALIALPYLVGFREHVTLQKAYSLGMLLGGVLILMWVTTIYLWKE